MGQTWDAAAKSRSTWRRIADVGDVVALIVNRLLWIVPGGFVLGAAAQSLITAGHLVVAELLVGGGIATMGVAIIVIAANWRWTR